MKIIFLYIGYGALAFVIFLIKRFNVKCFGMMLLLSALLVSSCEQSNAGRDSATVDTNLPDVISNEFNDLRKAQGMQQVFCQGWVNKEDARDAEGMDVDSDMRIVYRGYHFFEDGTVVKDPRGNLLIGKYTSDFSVKPVTVHTNFPGELKEEMKLAYLGPTELIFATETQGESIKTTYEGRAISHRDPARDPFYKANLAWRIKPTRRETDQEIKARLKGCINFFELFYQSQVNSKAKKVSFIGLPSCFKWHAGGIFIKKKDVLPQNWKDCFYDDKDALKAWEIANKLFSRKYTWPKGNWLQQNSAVLSQMKQALDSIPPL